MNLNELYPQIVWNIFQDICKVPRPSKNEGKMIEFLTDFAKKHNLEYTVDKTGNVIIRKPASKGCENKPSVALQSHIDMVCEKNSNKEHDFLKDPIKPYITEDGQWVKADGTTLGADDGIGVAAELAILISDDIEHGPLECLFTVDEETGLTGAFGLEPDVLKSKILLNLDSEDDGEIFIGCAGGVDTVGTLTFKKAPVIPNAAAFKVSVYGLVGGHSGDDINKGRGNSNKLLNRFIYEYSKKHTIDLAYFDGGNLRNAIPREAYAIVTVPDKQVNTFKKAVAKYEATIKAELEMTDAGVSFDAEKTNLPKYVMEKDDFVKFIRLIYAMPHGVISMSFKLKGIVETSTNLASIKFNGNKITITTSQRSDSESLKADIAAMVENCLLLAGAKIQHSDGYPGWTPNPDSPILHITLDVYKDLFGTPAIFRSIHAGLECGLFSTKYPDMDMVSYGPTLRGVHSPDEKIEIHTVEKFWKMTLEILKRL
ncbi:MAG: aminoacyl-histidine dipeptidase [Bacteroidales bacterium]|jgi:dipeptidase D|nr:aminoacyl-histidine dipeptidase [Bacteroidales bacterium]MDD2205547.1 aminoacyl-histidine dipeptidase [Bacteroidales bacterium]MDD3151699.1 aminoacyl-histidine dipeptidase [Bacteroidales bacterium]MDD3914221.1 aminoacyl-histidine dipeptidase [Bacteroidales bacterium]MDD4634802.1 aminoacyl-histidine dipeptidase [Bacteroidales bacterium]